MDNIQEMIPAVAAEPEIITHQSFEQLDQELQCELEREAEGFVKIGYMLKIFRDTTILVNTEYKDVNDYAMKRFHLDKSQVSRFTRINDRFSEGGYSDKLQDKFRGLGYAKLAIMLQLPEAIADEITPAFSKSEVLEIKEEIDEEKKTSEIELLLETQDAKVAEQDTNLKKVVWQMLHDNTELYKKLHEQVQKAKAEQFVLKKAKLREDYHNILAPQGEGIYSVRLQGMGRMMLSIKETGRDINLIHVRSGEKEVCTWNKLVCAVENCMCENMSAEESYKHQYGEEWQEEKKEEVAPVQNSSTIPVPMPAPKPEKKAEPRKQSKVSKAPTPKPKKEEPPVAVEEKYEPLAGQTTVEDIPGIVPEEYKETVIQEEENKESVSTDHFVDVNKTLSEDTQELTEEEKDQKDRYKRDYFLCIAEANSALQKAEYDITIKHLQEAIEMVSNMQEC